MTRYVGLTHRSRPILDRLAHNLLLAALLLLVAVPTAFAQGNGQGRGGGRGGGGDDGGGGGSYQLLYTPTGEGFDYTVKVVAIDVYFRSGQINHEGDVSGQFVNDGWRGYVWTEEDGFVDLSDYLPDGIDSRVRGMSDRDADGYIELFGNSDGVAWRAAYRVGSVASSEDDTPEIHWESLGYLYSHRRTPGRSYIYDNRLGVLVGSTTTSDGSRAARYTDEQGWESLGTLAPPKSKSGQASVAYCVNELGVVVGDSRIGNPDDVFDRRSFIYTDDAGMVMLEQLIDDLPDAAVGFLNPQTINLYGEICGPLLRRGYGGEDYDRAYVLIPRPVD